MEEWKDIEGYECIYRISNIGRVKSLKFGKERILKLNISDKYSRIHLKLDGYGKSYLVSRLVAKHFIPNPYNYYYVLHKKEDLDEKGALYNGADNLFWGTSKDNSLDCHIKGRSNNHFILNHPMKGKFGKNHHSSKKVKQYTKDGEFIKEWGSIIEIEKELGICNTSIIACCKGKLKTSGKFKWSYTNITQ